MASVRLNKTLKNDITNTLITRATSEEEFEFTRQAQILQQKLAQHFWGDVYQHVVQIYNYDGDMIRNLLQLRLNGFTRLGYENSSIFYQLPFGAPWPDNLDYWIEVDQLPKEVQSVVTAFAEKHFEKEKRHATLKNQITSLVHGCNTFAQLYDVFPELREIAAQLEPANMPTETPGLPAVEMTALKAALKLPSEKYQGEAA